jgi:UDP:flavonoid glycosyltransferase YjiC (YdhE family)
VRTDVRPVRAFVRPKGLDVLRILFASVGAYGHLYPLIPLALAAQGAGHDVAVAVDESFHPTVKSAGLAAVAAGLTIEKAFGVALAELDERPKHMGELGVPVFTRIMPEQTLDDLNPVLQSGAWDLVVHEMGNVGAAVAARTAGVPAATTALGRIASEAHFELMFAGWAKFAAAHGVEVKLPLTLDQPYIDTCPPSFQTASLSAEVATRIMARPRPWNPAGSLPAAALDRAPGRPLVYLTLGTTGAFAQPAVLRQMTTALADVAADALLASGPAVPADSLETVPDNVTVVDWVPQAELMPHVNVAVHHGGSGTLFAALANGVPQVLIPQGADQFANADWLAGTGAGIRILPDEVTPSSIAGAIEELLGNQEATAAAHRLRAEIERMPSMEECVERLTTWAR